jgi:hypothetical protein
MNPEAEFMNVEVSVHNLETSQTFEFPYTVITLQTSFKPLLLQEGGEGKIC